MPYENEHSARVKNPGSFQPDSFRRKELSDGVSVIMGKLKGESSMTAQAYRFKADKFTAKQARDWLKENNITYIEFEPAAEDAEAIFKMYGDIGSDITAEQISAFLDESKSFNNITIRINSRGGDVTEGWTIHDLLVNSGKHVKTIGEGKIYSIATIIFLAGHDREIMQNTEAVIHNPFVPEYTLSGEYEGDDLMKIAEYLKREEAKILDFYARVTGMPKEQLADYMKEEKALTADDMLRFGFATKIVEPVKAYAYVKPNILNSNVMNDDQKALFEKLGEKLDNLVSKVTNLSKPKVANIVITDRDGKELTVERESGDPAVGDKASPDGTFVMEDGKTIVVMNGAISEIKEADTTDLEVAEQKIKELEAEIADLKDKATKAESEKEELVKAEASFKEKEKEAKDLVEELVKLKNSYKPDARNKQSAIETGGVDFEKVKELRGKLKNAKTE